MSLSINFTRKGQAKTPYNLHETNQGYCGFSFCVLAKVTPFFYEPPKNHPNYFGTIPDVKWFANCSLVLCCKQIGLSIDRVLQNFGTLYAEGAVQTPFRPGMRKKIVVLTGAGISAESGVKTFRDSDGLWEQHRIEEVATPEAWRRNPELVQRFYNQRRRQLLSVHPNAGHLALVELEKAFEVNIITQNVDDLHERAGSTQVLHLHGELRKVRSERYAHLVYDWDRDLEMGDLCDRGAQLRPHIVWFGESVPLIEPAARMTEAADVLMIIGTSLQVYPAAGLMAYAPRFTPIYYIDPHPQANAELRGMPNLEVVAEPATIGVPLIVNRLLNSLK